MNTSSAALALLCLVASGFLDLVFKLYSNKPRSRGMLIFGVGCVWFALQSLTMWASQIPLALTPTTITYGVVAALFVTLSNILLLECLGHMPISMASTIYRLNTIPLVIMAWLWLGEDIGWAKASGISTGIVAVLLLYQRGQNASVAVTHQFVFLGLIIGASCIRALYGVTTKAGLSDGADANTMMLIAAAGWCIGGLAYAGFRERRIVITHDKLKFMAVAGFLVFAVVWLLTTALQLGDASFVVPVANMGFVAAFILSLIVGLETLSRRKLVALGAAIISILLLTTNT